MAAAIIPAIQLGISAYSAYKTNQAQKKAQQQQQQLMDESAKARGEITKQAPQFFDASRQLQQIGVPLLQTTGNYYKSLIGGDRGAIDSALAPDRAALQETYAGAQKGITNLRGPTRDLAQAELAKSRAGAMGLLPSIARANAVEGGQRAGEFATTAAGEQRSRGASLFESAAGLAGGAANTGVNQGYLQLAQGAQNASQAKGMGTLIGQVLTGILNRNQGGGAQSPVPTTTWRPPMSPYPSSIYGRV